METEQIQLDLKKLNEEFNNGLCDYYEAKKGKIIWDDEYNIKKLKSVWGKCSSSKKITINQDLMMYSRHAIEYVVLHEFCHLKYMNHSKNFWSLVEKYMPDYKEAEKELKK